MDNHQTEQVSALVEESTELLSPGEIEAESRRISQRLDARKRLLMAAAPLLRHGVFFHDFGGNPWLIADGARRLALALNITHSAPFSPTGAKEMFDVKYVDNDIFVTCAITAEWPRIGSAVVDLGTCDTQDKFFRGDDESRALYRQYLERTGDDHKKAAQMLVGYICKKAFANALSRAVTAVTGLSGTTWEELGHLGLAVREGATSHKYTQRATRESKAAAKQVIDRMPICDVKELAIGSKAAIGGTIKYADKGPKSHKYTLLEGGSMIVLYVRSQDELPDWATAGNEVWVPELEVGKPFQGKPMFWANKGIQLAGAEAEPE